MGINYIPSRDQYYVEINVAGEANEAPFTSIQNAIDSITDNSASKRYAIRVHPGTYTGQITMEDYVDLVAVGGREQTIISYTCTAHDAATVTGENAMLKGFTVISDGDTGTYRARCLNAATAAFEVEDCVFVPQNSAANAVGVNATASCDMRSCVIDSASGATTGTLFTTAAQTYNIVNCDFDGGTDAIQVTTTPTLNLENCDIADNLNQDGGTVNIRRSRVEAVAIGTAAGTLSVELSRFSGAFATADAFAHTISCEHCGFNGQNFNNAATGATTITLRNCTGIATLTNAGVAGTLTVYESGIETLTTSQGTVIVYGGRVNACGGSTGTSFVWWRHANELAVLPNMTIANALASAAAGDVIQIGSGTYAESNLTLVAGVNLVGVDQDDCIISVAGAAVPILAAGVTCEVSRLTITNGDATGTAITVTANTLTVRNCTISGTGVGDAIAMTAGTLVAYDTTIVAGDIDLSTANCILSMHRCRITTDPVDTAGAFAHAMIFQGCCFGAQSLVSAATGATSAAIRGCTFVNVVSNAGTGIFTIRSSDVATVTCTNAAGSILIRGGYVNACGGATGSVTWKTAPQYYRVAAGMSIQHAIAAAAADTPAPAVGSPYTINIVADTYSEALTGSAYITLAGESPNNTIITQASGDLVTLGGIAGFGMVNLTLQLTAAAAADALVELATGANTAVVLRNVIFDMTGAAAGNALYAVNSDSAFAHTVTIERCQGTIGGTGASSFVRDSAGTTTATMRHNTLIMDSANGFVFTTAATVLTVNAFGDTYHGTGALYTSGAAAHRITLSGGVVDTDAASVHGAGTLAVWKTGKQQYEVNRSLFIQDAITAAAADTPAPAVGVPYNIIIHPGVYAESNVTLSASVHLVGTHADSCRIVTGDAANPIVASAVNTTVSDLTFGNTNAGAPALAVTANSLMMWRCVLYGTGAGDCITMVAGDLTAYDSTIGVGDIDLSTAGCTLSMYRCRITTDPVDTAGAFAHAMVFENCDFGTRNLASAATGATTLSMRSCAYVGTVTNAGTGTFHIRNSSIDAATTATGVIRLRNTQYRAINRTGTGVIIDESPEAKSYGFKTLKRLWEVAAIANQNIATRTAVGGAVLAGGSGQVRLRINDNALDAAGTEAPADAAGSLDSSWTPARGPRYCIGFSINVLRATTSIFWGLRATLGAAVPALAEHHAGFIWTGAAFNASSSNGGGVGEVTALVNPSLDTQHQLEVMVVGATAVEFYVDGALVAAHTTAAGVPTAALDFQEYEISTGGGGATTSDITLREGFIQESMA